MCQNTNYTSTSFLSVMTRSGEGITRFLTHFVALPCPSQTSLLRPIKRCGMYHSPLKQGRGIDGGGVLQNYLVILAKVILAKSHRRRTSQRDGIRALPNAESTDEERGRPRMPSPKRKPLASQTHQTYLPEVDQTIVRLSSTPSQPIRPPKAYCPGSVATDQTCFIGRERKSGTIPCWRTSTTKRRT